MNSVNNHPRKPKSCGLAAKIPVSNRKAEVTDANEASMYDNKWRIYVGDETTNDR